MAEFKLLIETGTDLSRKYIMQEENLAVMPLDLIVDGKEYKQDPAHPQLLPSQFYDQQRSGKQGSVTALHSHQIADYMKPILQSGQDILYLGLNDRMGGNLQAAKEAANLLLSYFPRRKIGVVDTGCVSLGQGLLVQLCNEYVKEGHTLEETEAYATETAGKIHHLFVVEHPKYLARSKVIHPLTGLWERTFNIKPIYQISGGGMMKICKKPNGKEKAFTWMAQQTARQWRGGKIYIAHADALSDAGKLKGMLKKKNPELAIEIGDIGPAIGVRCGAGTVAVFYKGDQ